MIILFLVSSIFIYMTIQYMVSGGFFCRHFRYNILNVFCIYITIGLLNIIFGYKLALIINNILYLLLGFAFFYVHEFRGTNFNFQDLMSIGTAKEVAGGYKFIIKPRFVFITLLYLIISFYTYVLYAKNFDYLINIIYINRKFDIYFTYILLFISLYILLLNTTSKHYNYGIDAGEIEGYIYNFFFSIPIFHICDIFKNKEVVEGAVFKYNNVYDEYINNNKIYNKNINKNIKDKPDIICILNESFGSLQEILKTNVPVTPYFDNMKNVEKGYIYVNTIGGGTSNTEYDFLTYSNTGISDYPIYPFNNLVKNNTYSLARYFKNIGYKTMAFHPYTRTNYNRHNVYKYFGFDDYVSFDNMIIKNKDRKYIRNFLSDESMYKEIINQYEKLKKKNKNIFMYNVSIQNHGGYDNLDNKLIHIKNNKIKNKNAVENYLTLMKYSDESIHILIDYFKKRKNHVIIIFMGDHNASFGRDVNREIFGKVDNYQFSKLYKVPYFIYDNKHKLNSKNNITSPNFLARKLIKISKLPFDYDLKYMDDLSKYVKSYNYDKIINIKKYKNIIKYNMLQKYIVLRGHDRL